MQNLFKFITLPENIAEQILQLVLTLEFVQQYSLARVKEGVSKEYIMF